MKSASRLSSAGVENLLRIFSTREEELRGPETLTSFRAAR
jgi:hypothetical protein